MNANVKLDLFCSFNECRTSEFARVVQGEVTDFHSNLRWVGWGLVFGGWKNLR
jgi:hypothetical protein